MAGIDQEQCFDSDDSMSQLSGSSPLLTAAGRGRQTRQKLRKNLANFLGVRLKKMIHFLRSQEQQFLKLSKRVGGAEGFDSEFDFMTQEIEDDWGDVEGREDMVVIDIKSQDSSEEMKRVLEKINTLTKMLSSVNEVSGQ